MNPARRRWCGRGPAEASSRRRSFRWILEDREAVARSDRSVGGLQRHESGKRQGVWGERILTRGGCSWRVREGEGWAWNSARYPGPTLGSLCMSYGHASAFGTWPRLLVRPFSDELILYLLSPSSSHWALTRYRLGLVCLLPVSLGWKPHKGTDFLLVWTVSSASTCRLLSVELGLHPRNVGEASEGINGSHEHSWVVGRVEWMTRRDDARCFGRELLAHGGSGEEACQRSCSPGHFGWAQALPTWLIISSWYQSHFTGDVFTTLLRIWEKFWELLFLFCKTNSCPRIPTEVKMSSCYIGVCRMTVFWSTTSHIYCGGPPR